MSSWSKGRREFIRLNLTQLGLGEEISIVELGMFILLQERGFLSHLQNSISAQRTLPGGRVKVNKVYEIVVRPDQASFANEMYRNLSFKLWQFSGINSFNCRDEVEMVVG